MSETKNIKGSHWLYLGLFSIASLSLFKELIFTNTVLFYGDLIELYYAAKKLSLHLLSQQGIGAWNPYVDGGQPLLADANFAYILYPGNLVFLFTSIAKGFSVLVLIHHIIAAMGMFLCTLKLTRNSIVAGASALFFVLSGFFLTSMYRPPCFFALSWLPWVAWLWLLIEEHPRQGFFYLAFISVLQVLTGEFQIFLLTHICGISVALGARKPAAFLRQASPHLIFLPIAVVLLAAAQILPSLEYIFLSAGSDEYFLQQLNSNSYHPLLLFQFILPIALPLLPTEPGYVIHEYLLGAEQHFFFISNHTGIVVFTLALLGIGTLNKRQKIFWVGLPAFFVIISFGAHLPLAKSIYTALLPFSAVFTNPIYFALPLFFFIPLLAALNIADHINNQRWTTYQLGVPSLLILIIFGLNMAANYFFQHSPPFDGLALRALRDTFGQQIVLSGFLLTALAICYGAATRVKSIPLVLLLLGLAELFSYAPKVLWKTDAKIFATPTALDQNLINLQPELIPDFRLEHYGLATPPPTRGSAQHHHVEQQRWVIHAMKAHTGLAKHFAYTRRNRRLQLANVKRYWEELSLSRHDKYQLMGTRYFLIGSSTEKAPSFIDNLEHLKTSKDLKVYYDTDALPSAWSSESWQSGKATSRVKTLNEPPPISGLKVFSPKPAEHIERTGWPVHDAFHGYRLKVSLEEPSVLVIADNAYPGWEAQVNNRKQKIGLAYGRFKALALPPGEHNIRLQFRSSIIFWGSTISIASWLTLLTAFAFFVIRRKLREREQKRENAKKEAEAAEESDAPGE